MSFNSYNLENLCHNKPNINKSSSLYAQEEKIITELKNLPKNFIGSPGVSVKLSALLTYLNWHSSVHNQEIITRFLNAQTTVDSLDSTVRKIVALLPYRYDIDEYAYKSNPAQFRKKIVASYKEKIQILTNKGFVLQEIHFKDFCESIINDISDIKKEEFYSAFIQNFLDMGFKSDVIIECLLFGDKRTANYNNTSINTLIIDIFKTFTLTTNHNLTVKDLERAYLKGLHTTVTLLQDTFKIKPNNICLKNYLKSGDYYYLEYTNVSNLLKSGIKPDNDDLKTLMNKKNANDYITLLIEKNTLDLKIHTDIIIEHFHKVSTPGTLKKLLNYGFKPTAKCLEKLFLGSGNFSVVKILIEDYGFKPNQTCLENACAHKNNANVINYLLETGGCIPNAKCLSNFSDALRNPTLKLLLDKFLKNYGDQFEPLIPVYGSDEE